MRKVILFFLVFFLFIFSGCNPIDKKDPDPKEDELTLQQKEIYQMAVDVGYNGTFDEWLNSIKGEKGEPGKQGLPGKNVELTVQDGFIKWRNEGDANWYNLVSFESLIDIDGLNEKEIEFNVSRTHIQWRYVGEKYYKDLVALSIISGETGKGIKLTEINNLGELIITYSDDTTQNLGQLFKSFLIKFVDYNGYIIDVQHIVYGQDATEPTNPVRYGYEFVGWDQDLENITSDLIINAVYKINEYTITFNSNGGNKINTIIQNYGTNLYLPTPVKEGHDFFGWYSKNGTLYNNDNKLEKNLDLYAKWSLKTYKVTFVDYNDTELFITYAQHGTTIIEPNNPVRAGYEFIGWNKDIISIKNELKVKALYKPSTFTISFDSLGGEEIDDITVSYDEEIVLPSTAKDGYDFKGWIYEDETLNDTFVYNYLSDITLKALWTKTPYSFTYNINNGEVAITGYNSDYHNVVIPSTLEGYPVTTITNDVFKDNNSIEYLKVGNNVTTLGNNVFANMEKLIKLELPNATKNIGKNILYGTNAINHITLSSELPYALNYYFGEDISFVPDSLKTIRHSTGAAFISPKMFEYNTKNVTLQLADDLKIISRAKFMDKIFLTSIVIPRGVTSIEENAFCSAKGLTTIIFEEGSQLTTIREGAFKLTERLTSITIPSQVTDIGKDAFFGTSSLATVAFESGSKLTNIGESAFQFAGRLTNITIPSGVKVYGNNAFKNTDNLTTVTFAEGSQLETIGDYAFSETSNLSDITIPSGVTNIGEGVFKSAKALTNIVIPSGVTKIEKYAFQFATSLKNIVIPSKVSSIGKEAFYGASGLNIITFEEGTKLSSIGDSAFQYATSLTKIVIPRKVTYIGKDAFYGANILRIYAEIETKPIDWHLNWNPSNRPVTWNYSEE